MDTSFQTKQPQQLLKKKRPQWIDICLAMLLGGFVGYIVFFSFSTEEAAEFAEYISLISDIFLRLIKMLIGPLVFSTLVVGIAHMGDAKSVG